MVTTWILSFSKPKRTTAVLVSNFSLHMGMASDWFMGRWIIQAENSWKPPCRLFARPGTSLASFPCHFPKFETPKKHWYDWYSQLFIARKTLSMTFRLRQTFAWDSDDLILRCHRCYLGDSNSAITNRPYTSLFKGRMTVDKFESLWRWRFNWFFVLRLIV